MARSRRLEVVIAGDAKGALASMSAVDAKAGGLGSSFKVVGAAAVAGFAVVGAAAAGAAVGLFKVGESFDEAYDKIRVGTGATGEALEGLKNSFRDVARDVPSSFGDISTAITDINARLGLTGAPLESLSTQMLNLSRITETDLTGNIENLTRVFGDWGIQADQMPATMDRFFRASQATGAGVDSLAQQVVQFGAPLRNLGFSLDESVAMFGAFEQEGVNTTTVLSGMRQGLRNFAGDGEAPAEAFRRFTQGVQDGTYGMTEAMEVFGGRAGADMFAAIKEGRFDFEALTATIANGSDTINGASADTEDFAEKWTRLKNRVLLALEPIAMRVFDAVGQAMDDLGPKVTQLAAWFTEEIPPAMARIEATFNEVWPRVREVFLGAMAAVSEWWAQNGPGIMAGIGQLVDTFRTGFDAARLVVERVFGVISNLWDRFGQQWLQKVQTAFSAITQAFRGAFQMIQGVLDVFVGVFTGDWSRAWDGVKGIFQGAWNAIIGLGRAAINGVSGVIGAGMALISAAWGYAWRGIRGVFTRVWDGIKAAASGAIDAVKGTIRAGVDAVGRIWGGIKSAMSGPLNWVIENVINRFLGVMRTVADVVNLGSLIPGNVPLVGGGEGGGGHRSRTAIEYHTGGVVGSTGGRRRMGPLRAGEIPAVLQTGETVVDRMGMVAGRPAADVLAQRYGVRSDSELRAMGLPIGGFPNPVSAITGLAGDAVNFVSDRLRDLAAGGLSALLDPIRGSIGEAGSRFGIPGRVFGGMVNKPIDALIEWVSGAAREAAKRAAPAFDKPGHIWQQLFDAVRRQFPDVRLHSGFRPGSITATGRLSRHALGRAVDLSPRMDIFNWIAQNYPGSHELIFSPAGGRQLYRGRPHVYSEPTRGDHWDHIHWSMANGGLVKGGRGGVRANIGEGTRDELVTPLPAGGIDGLFASSRAATPSIVVNIHGTASAADGQAVVDALRRWQRTNGPVPVRVNG